jgi:hypothetical protein
MDAAMRSSISRELTSSASRLQAQRCLPKRDEAGSAFRSRPRLQGVLGRHRNIHDTSRCSIQST